MFKNVKNSLIFSDKLKLFVVDLTRIDMATEEDKAQGIDHWARLFKATTWEEIKMLSSKDSCLAEAAETAYQLSAEETIRMQCEAREDYYRQQRYIQKKMKRLEELEHLEEKSDQLERNYLELQKNNAELQQSNEELQQSNEELQQSNVKLQQSNADKEEALAASQEEIARLKAQIAKLQEKGLTV